MTSSDSRLRRRCLILVAHGSRRGESNEEIALLAGKLGHSLQQDYDEVTHAFREIAHPSIPDVIDSAVQRGYNNVTVLPYFLAAGTHVIKDIPTILRQKQNDYPKVNFRLTRYLGADARIVDILTALSREVVRD